MNKFAIHLSFNRIYVFAGWIVAKRLNWTEAEAEGAATATVNELSKHLHDIYFKFVCKYIYGFIANWLIWLALWGVFWWPQEARRLRCYIYAIRIRVDEKYGIVLIDIWVSKSKFRWIGNGSPQQRRGCHKKHISPLWLCQKYNYNYHSFPFSFLTIINPLLRFMPPLAEYLTPKFYGFVWYIISRAF